MGESLKKKEKTWKKAAGWPGIYLLSWTASHPDGLWLDGGKLL